MPELARSNLPPSARLLKQVASVCALPSWVLLAGYILFRIFVGGNAYPPVIVLPVPATICVLASLVSITLYPLGMDERRFGKLDVLWIWWAELPLLIGLVYWVISFLGGGDFMPGGC